MDKGIEVAPRAAMWRHRSRALSTGTPDTTHDGVEADAVLLGGPKLYPLLWVRLPQGADYGW
jgi:hypothetical protein